jgi:hypothetical protein
MCHHASLLSRKLQRDDLTQCFFSWSSISSEPSALSETFRPPFGVPEGDGDASGYHGRDRRLRPLRWKVGGMREYVTDKCCNRADRRLSSGAIDCPVHLCKKGNRNGRTDNAANRGEECVLETERGENISARHYEKAGEPSSSELFSSGASKPTSAQIIECIENAELETSHRQPLSPWALFHRDLVVRHATDKG